VGMDVQRVNVAIKLRVVGFHLVGECCRIDGR